MTHDVVAAELDILRLSPAHWELYRDLRLAALRDSPHAFGSTLESELELEPSAWRHRLRPSPEAIVCPVAAVGRSGGVGLAFGRYEPAHPTTALLFQMWVAPGARGRGVAAQLLNAVVEWARSTGAVRLRLGVAPSNLPARRLYQRHGFRAVAAAEDDRPDLAGCDEMVLALGPGC